MAKDSKMVQLMDHYTKSRNDMDTRRTRKNGYNDIIDAYMGKLPANWPFLAVVTDPRIRTTILEKTARLLNSKLQGRLVPREGGDIIKARINNAILDFQWDFATNGGSMIEKVAKIDQVTRIFGAGFVQVYWDVEKDSNEIKFIDPRDIAIDWAADHVRGARWVQVREFATSEDLEARGYNISKLKDLMAESTSDFKDSSYESQVLANKYLQSKVGRDLSNPVIEVVTEWTPSTCTIFAPRHKTIVYEGKNPYKHGKIPVSMLRYYPIPDDVMGDSEVESVIPIQRAINAFLCGTIDELAIAQRPPVKIVSGGATRMETIEYGPGAKWIVDNPNSVTEHQMAINVMNNFERIYSTLVAAFETAMGGQSLGVSNVGPLQKNKTATEVVSLEKKQTSRDQYNQLYLGEFLKDIMLMWLSNNKQYLFDDPSKKYQIFKIIGKDNIQQFQAMMLDEMEVPPEAMEEIAQTVAANPDAVDTRLLEETLKNVSVPKNPIILNPDEENPENYEVKAKFDVIQNGEEADLYVTPEDMEGIYDYVPDVKSMGAGAGIMMQQARSNFMDRILNPQVTMMLQSQGDSVNIKELLIGDAENAGYKDAQSLFTTAQPNQQTATGNIPGGPSIGQPGNINSAMGGINSLPTNNQALLNGPVGNGMAQPNGLFQQTPTPGGFNP